MHQFTMQYKKINNIKLDIYTLRNPKTKFNNEILLNISYSNRNYITRYPYNIILEMLYTGKGKLLVFAVVHWYTMSANLINLQSDDEYW